MAEPTAVAAAGSTRRIESGSWVATFEPGRGLRCELTPAAGGRPFAVVDPVGEPEPRASTAAEAPRLEAGVRLLFDGLLHNSAELARQLGLAPGSGEIDLLWAAYRRWGEQLAARLDGVFALVLWDAANDVLLAATDQLGSVPVYYADCDGDLVLSPSLAGVVSRRRVPATLDRVVLTERLQHIFHSAAETRYQAVRSLLPGHLLGLRRPSWRPVPYAEPRLGDELSGLGREELQERFNALFEQAVARCLGSGPAAVLLSGGLDSVAIAEAAVDIARQGGLDRPVALSFYLPAGSAAGERAIQERVAHELGMTQTLIAPASDHGSLLADGLECSRRAPFPIMNIWAATLSRLLGEAAGRGCSVVLWGAGGDEWLGLNFSLAADLLLAGRWRSLALLRRTLERSYGMPPGASLRAVLWRYGMRLILREAMIRAGGLAPGAFDRLRERRAVRRQAVWLGDDRELGEALRVRAAQRSLRRERGGFHRRDRLEMLRRPLQSVLRRQGFYLAARFGLRSLEPFWDRRLVEFLAVVPPELLMDGGLSKSPLRARLAARFPELGFAGQKKYDYEGYVYDQIRRQSREIGVAARGTPALVRAGVADDVRMRRWLGRVLEERSTHQVHYLWTVLSTEAWLAART